MTPLFHITPLTHDTPAHHYRATLTTDHSVFGGHFPDAPVVPGVMTMQLVRQCCADALRREVSFHEIKEAKFLAPILPHRHNEVEIQLSIKDDNNLTAQVSHHETTMMKLKATLR